MEKVFALGRRIIPKALFNFAQNPYHYLLALLAGLIYRFPAWQIKVIAVTGTKGKTTVCELLGFILNEAGYKTAVSSTLRSERSTPGRFAMQKFLRRTVRAECRYAVIEMTSQAVLQYRHKFIKLDTLIFTGIHPEHIEAHGSFENYLDSKLELARTRPGIIVANLDDEYGQRFLEYGQEKIGYRLSEFGYQTKLLGDFNKLNIIAAAKCAKALGVPEENIRNAVAKFEGVPGRVEFVKNNLGIDVVIDYAHTPGSLEAIYKALRQAQSKNTNQKLICVFGACGGGRDKWKRPEFGKLADQYCSHIILTNEDPYNEDPRAIVNEIETGIADKSKYEVEMDRRKAIARALSLAVAPPLGGGTASSVVLITGKGTDPYIMGPRGSKTPWSDKTIALEELAKLRN
ncbi:MAG TPA: Mur ligase family protein [Candidatus Paceibacterota bacterium]